MSQSTRVIRMFAVTVALSAIGFGTLASAQTQPAGVSARATRSPATAPSTAPAAAPAPAAPAATPAAAAPAAAPARAGWPTEEEAKAAIFKVEHDIYASQTNKDVWHVKDMKHEVKSVRFANETAQKQMRYGAQAQTVYPAKILYTRITEYTDKAPVVEEQGKDGVWFFYKDSFGDWTCKYGSE